MPVDQRSRWYGQLRGADLDAEEFARHVDAMDALSARDRRRALGLFDETGDVGIRAVNRLVDAEGVDAGATMRRLDEFDGAARRGVAEALDDGVSPQRVGRSLKRFENADLSRSQRRLYENLLGSSDSDLRNSWIQTTGWEDLESGEIKDSLEQVRTLRDEGHRLSRFRTSKDVNLEERRERGRDEPPYATGTIVTEFETGSEKIFVRAWGTDLDNEAGDFVVREVEISGQSDRFLPPDEIQRTLALPYRPTTISEVHIDPETRMRVGEVNDIFEGEEGATQHQLIERISDDSFQNPQELDDD